MVGQPPVKRTIGGSIPSTGALDLSIEGAIGRAAKVPGFHPGEAGSIPAWHSCEIRSIQMRGRLTVGSDALNIEMLVRFQPSQLVLRHSNRSPGTK